MLRKLAFVGAAAVVAVPIGTLYALLWIANKMDELERLVEQERGW